MSLGSLVVRIFGFGRKEPDVWPIYAPARTAKPADAHPIPPDEPAAQEPVTPAVHAPPPEAAPQARRAPLLPEADDGESIGPDGRRRSVLFLHNAYYHYFYLAPALRRRGWDAVAVSLESPESPNAAFYHGDDVNLFAPDPAVAADRAEKLVEEISARFCWIHFSGDGVMAINPVNQDVNARRDRIPWEFLAFKKAGMKISYAAAGCTDGISQTAFRRFTANGCASCELQGRPDVCSDMRNLAWGHKREMLCDLIATEMLPALDYCRGPKAFREPLTFGVHPEIWQPDLDIPIEHKIEREPGEVLIFHAVGNYRDPHYAGERDYKGTQAVIAAIEGLKAEGLPVRLIFVHDLLSTQVRFVQVQADIVVDQLRFTRYGATAREAMMLWRPVVGLLRKDEEDGQGELYSVQDSPIVNATTGNIQDVLRALVLDEPERRRLGRRSREWALKWHSVDALAARFEAVYDHVLMGGKPADAPIMVDGVDVREAPTLDTVFL